MPQAQPDHAKPHAAAEQQLRATNLAFYDALWRDADLVQPGRFNTWPALQPLATAARCRLEIAPGLRPRLPIDGTHCVDISSAALATLAGAGALAATGSIQALPYADAAFDLVCALDIVEHVDDDARAFAELARVAAPGAALVLSAPLHMARWNAFDDFVGHRRRYEPAELQARLAQHGFTVERSAVYGMQPKSSKLLDLGMWYLIHQRERAMWWYNRVFMPLGMRFQKPLDWQPALLDLGTVDEVLMLCRKTG
ncbi:MAG: hypothetical protein NVS9B10_08970 [Nevskia sp.]